MRMNPTPFELQQMLAAAADAGDVQARTFLPMFRSFTARLGSDPAGLTSTLVPCGDKQVRLDVSKAPCGCPTSAS